MKFRLFVPALVAATTLACTAPAVPPPAVSLAASGLAPSRALDGTARVASLLVPMVHAAASSTLAPGWSPQHAIDGDLASAWAPAVQDAQPALTLFLGGKVDLRAIAIKVRGARAGVAVDAWVRGAWVTVSSGFQPAEATLDVALLPTTSTNRIRLRFAAADARDLRVDEVQAVAATLPPRGTASIDCFSLISPQAADIYADATATLPTATMTISGLVRTPTSVAGSVLLVAYDVRTSFTGAVTSATYDGSVMTLGGTLVGGGTFVTESLFVAQVAPDTVVVTPASYLALIPVGPGVAGYSVSDADAGRSRTERFAITVGCD